MKNSFITFTTIVAMLFLITATSFAVVMNYFVKAQGIDQVSPPEFYIGEANNENETLLINEKSPNCAHFSITNSFTRAFKTGDLGGVNFKYVPKVEFSVRASMTGTTTPQVLTLKFGYISGGSPINICQANVLVTNHVQNYTTTLINCSGKPVNADQLYYEMTGNCQNCNYTISKCSGNFYTKIKLAK